MATAATPLAAGPVWREEMFASKDGTQLFHASLVPEAPRAAVLVIHGYGDHALRYRHVLEALAAKGFAAHAVDYRGHGHAGGKRGFCGSFNDFLDDLAAFVERVRARSAGLPLFFLAHSHGALVTCTWVLERSPADVAGIVLTSPYFRLRIDPSRFQLFQALVVGKIIPWLPVKSPLTIDMLTRDEAMQKATAADPLYGKVVTPRWFTESNAAQAKLFERAKELQVPLLVLQGGDDAIAHPEGAQRFVELAGSADKKLVVYPGMLHEVLNEVDRQTVLGEVGGWIDQHLAARQA